MIEVCLSSWMLWTLLRATADHHRQTFDVLDDGEAVGCNTSLQPNKISYKSQRTALRGRHPIPPSFQQLSGGPCEWKKQDWDGKKVKEIETCRGEVFGGPWVGVQREKVNAWTRRKQRKKEKWWEPTLSFYLHWQFSGYLLQLLLSRWNGREMGS